MTGELLSLELIELKIFEHFMLLRNLEEIKIHDLANSKVIFGINLYVNHKGQVQSIRSRIKVVVP